MKKFNPKKYPEDRRKNRGKLIGGVYIPPALLREAQRRRIEYMVKEAVAGYGRVSRSQKIKIFLINLWQKLFRRTIQK